LFKAKDEEIADKSDFKPGTWFALEDADNAIKKMAKDKALGPNCFWVQLLVNKNSTESRARACKELTNIFNTCFIPDYLRVSRALLFFLNKPSLLCLMT
jgi:hypothetical protein